MIVYDCVLLPIPPQPGERVHQLVIKLYAQLNKPKTLLLLSGETARDGCWSYLAAEVTCCWSRSVMKNKRERETDEEKSIRSSKTGKTETAFLRVMLFIDTFWERVSYRSARVFLGDGQSDFSRVSLLKVLDASYSFNDRDLVTSFKVSVWCDLMRSLSFQFLFIFQFETFNFDTECHLPLRLSSLCEQCSLKTPNVCVFKKDLCDLSEIFWRVQICSPSHTTLWPIRLGERERANYLPGLISEDETVDTSKHN